MTTRNFRVHNGISVGDIVIDAATNKITGGSTAAPSADGDYSNKKYVDDQAAASLTLTNKTLTSPVLNGTLSGTAFLDEDNMASDSAIAAASQQSIKAYVDAQVTASDLDFQGDTGGALAIDLDSETLTFTGGTGIDTTGSGNAVTFAIDSTVATLAGSQTFTNKALTSPVLNTGVSGTAILDEDNLASNSDTQLATQQSIKAYVDNGLSSLSSTTLTAGNTTAIVSDTGSDGAFTVTADGNTELVVNDTSATFSGNVVVSGNFTVNGTTTTVATTNTTNTDNIYELGTGTTGTPANDAGLIIERGDSANAFIGFDESEDKFKVGTTSSTGAATGNLTITTGTLIANIEGDVTGNVTGNTSGTALTVTQAAQTSITSVGTLTALQVDNLNLNGNTLSSTAGTDLLITPLAGQQIVLDGTIVVDAGVVTGATSITSTNFVGDVTGDVTGNADTATTLATTRAIQVSGAVTGTANFDGSAGINIVTTNTADPTITLGGDLSGAVTLTNLASGTLTATIAANSVALGTDTTGNYVSSLVAGNLIDLQNNTGEGATPTIDVDLSELTTSTSNADGDFFVVLDSVNAQKKLTKGNIAISGFNNDSGFTTNTGDITSVVAGSGLTGGATSGAATLNIGAGTGIDVAADAISVDVSDFMTNGSNNRIVTATGTDAQNAEANLTFDGSTLAVTGAITATGDVTAFYVSDRNLKQNIVNIENSLHKVSQLNGVYYNWTKEALEKHKHLVDEKEVGVIAQDVEAVLPELVATREDGSKAVRYERLCAVLIESVKELKKEIDELKK